METMEKNDTRTITLTLRVSKNERDTIKENAKNCGMTISNYLRDVGCGHKPRHILTDDEKAAFDLLDGVRDDMIKFGNALRGLDSTQRKILFQTTDVMDKWIDILADEVDRIKQFFDKIDRRKQS